MNQTMKSARLLAVAVLLAVVLVAGQEVRAGSVNISGSSGAVPGTEPLYDYAFDVYLTPGNTIAYGDSFTVYDLAGVIANAGTSQPGGPLVGDLYTFSPQVTQIDSSDSNVTWYNTGINITNSTSSNLYVGQFVVDGNLLIGTGDETLSTTYTLVSGGVQSPPTSLGVTPGGITYLPQVSVPEPSSSILLVIGGAGLVSVFIRRQRRG